MLIISKRIGPRLNVLICLVLVVWMMGSNFIPPADAITIIRRHIPPGEHFEFNGMHVRAGQAPNKTIGEGNLIEIFNAAADTWERAIQDDHTVTIQYGWSPIPVGNGVHNVRDQGGVPNRVTGAIVYFDNDGSTTWFLDPTPQEHSEYPTVIECFADLGGGRVNSGRVLTGTVSSGHVLDLLTIAKHEIGHAIGLSTWNYVWVTKQVDRGIHVNSPRPFQETLIPTNTGGHLRLLGALMDPSLFPGQRKLISVVDLLAIAEMGEFLDLNLHPEVYPTVGSDLKEGKAESGCS